MKMIYMGTPDFAVGPLNALIKAGHQVKGVVTQPDRPKGRGKHVQITPVKEAALAQNIPVYQPDTVKEPSFIETLRTLEPDVIVAAAFGQLLPGEILHMPRFGCLNIHASLLPCYRGAAPIQWAIIDGREKTGVTIMQMDEGLDTGSMLLAQEVSVSPEETAASLFEKLSTVGSGLIVEALRALESSGLTPVLQTGESSYAPVLTKAMGKIDWNQPAEKIGRLVRGLNPWPGAYTCLQGKMLKIWAACPSEEEAFGFQPGQICETGRRHFSVKTGRGILRITRLQPEGKKQMDAGAFLRGYPLKEGVCLENAPG